MFIRTEEEMSMRKPQRVALLIVVVVVLVAIPAAVSARFSATRLDRFLKLRDSVLVQLEQNGGSLPAGVEHRMPHVPKASPTFPERQHIESVVGAGSPWFSDGYRFYELVLSDEVSAKRADEVAMDLEAHFANGLESLGLSSPVKGRAGYGGFGRGTSGRYWRDGEGRLIVTISVVVDQASKAAHVVRFTHERCD